MDKMTPDQQIIDWPNVTTVEVNSMMNPIFDNMFLAIGVSQTDKDLKSVIEKRITFHMLSKRVS